MYQQTNDKIKLYSSDTDLQSYLAKYYLESKGIIFKEINVNLNPRVFEELKKKLGSDELPVVEVSGNCIIGFDKNKIDEALKWV